MSRLTILVLCAVSLSADADYERSCSSIDYSLHSFRNQICASRLVTMIVHTCSVLNTQTNTPSTTPQPNLHSSTIPLPFAVSDQEANRHFGRDKRAMNGLRIGPICECCIHRLYIRCTPAELASYCIGYGGADNNQFRRKRSLPPFKNVRSLLQ